MIDGCNIVFYTPSEDTHILSFPWDYITFEDTGRRIKILHQIELRGLKIQLKKAKAGGYFLVINGSLHKFYNQGLHNHNQFTFFNLQETIHSIRTILGIEPEKCFLHGIEIGLNIKLDFSPLKIIKNVVCYKNKPFTQINKKSPHKGLQCVLSQYTVKVYDKAAQSGLTDENILRIETAINRMQAIEKYKIITLADLQCEAKVKPLVRVLEDSLNAIVWTDTSVNISRMTAREQKQWLYYSNPKTWQPLDKFKRNRAAKTWRNLLTKYATPFNLSAMIYQAWEHLFISELEAQKPQPFYHENRKCEAFQIATFLPFICTVKRLHLNNENTSPQKSDFHINISCYMFPYSEPLKFKKASLIRNKLSSLKRENKKCLSCGRNITNQRASSRFCSEAIFGKAGKACRNKQSNKIRTFKRSIETAKLKDKFLIFTYKGTNGIYSDVLHHAEITPYKGFFDDIVKIKIL